MLRFAGGLHIQSGRIVVEAELDTGAAARRLRRDILEVYGHQSDVVVIQGGGLRKGTRYVVRVVKDGEALARQTGLLDNRGRPVRGLPPQVVVGVGLRRRRRLARRVPGPRLADRARAARPRSRSTCPGPEAALALVGAARRLGISAKAREVRGVDRVVIRDGDAISAAADPARGPRVPAGLGGASAAPRGARHRQPAGELRRRQPPPVGPRRGRRRCPGRPCPGDPRRRGARPPEAAGSCASSTSRPASRSSASCTTRCSPRTPSPAASGGCWRWPTSAPQELGIPDTEASPDPRDADRGGLSRGPTHARRVLRPARYVVPRRLAVRPRPHSRTIVPAREIVA